LTGTSCARSAAVTAVSALIATSATEPPHHARALYHRPSVLISAVMSPPLVVIAKS
jgi:hypothetical protein